MRTETEHPRLFWIRLDRHNDPTEPASTSETTPMADIEPDSTMDAGPPAPKPTETVEYWKSRSRQQEQRAKGNAEKAKRFDELQAANQSEVERLTNARTDAEKRAESAIARAVTAEVRAHAAEAFADPSDAADVLAREPERFLTDDGDIDLDTIETALAELLERKPHWRKAAPTPEPTPPPAPPTPRPDPAQGARGGQPTNWLTADAVDVHTEMARLGIRPRST